jgi:SAM-dependent methyltransferase
VPLAQSAFDAAAAGYDAAFTATRIGTMMREAVWARCAARFAPASRILEMNCGTGEDARWLAQRGLQVLATDVSAAMVARAGDKLATAPGAANARLRQLAWEDLAQLDEPPFDGALSNFGGLNCVADLNAAAHALAACLRPGAVAVLCIMGPLVPWEWAWYLAHGKPAKAFRRLRRGGVPWNGITVRYPPITAMRRAFAPQFRCLRLSALGALLPPPYAEPRAGRWSRALAALNRAERRLETCWPLPQLADHYVIEFERR